MSENIALALENTVKLDRLEAQAADLQQAAGKRSSVLDACCV